MRAVGYTGHGDSGVLHLQDRAARQPGPGEVRVRIAVSGVNPTDWKARRGTGPVPPEGQVPGQDGAGTVDAVGAGVTAVQVGQRVWVWEAAWQRTEGTAQELVVLPERQVVPLPDRASYDVGASLGIPALTAHRCLTALEEGPRRLAPGALSGRTVLVAGGAGAVGHAAVQLARWAGATVVTTVSGPRKAGLAVRAGAHAVVNYREDGAARAVRDAAPDGVDLVVELALGANGALDRAVAAPGATVVVYADDGGDVTLPVREHMVANSRLHFVLVYTVPAAAKDDAVAAVGAALADGALEVGEEAGLPIVRFGLAQTAQAHDAVESGVLGKVLVDVP